MNPDMNSKVGKLFETIQFYVNYLSNESDTILLFKLLSMDLSPCLQKKIIMTYINFFKNHKIENTNKEKALDKLIKNNFFEIFEYVLSVSLLDVRIQLIELLDIISIELKEKFEKSIREKKSIIMDYVGEYIFPDNLKITLNEDNQIIPLKLFFNKKIYNDDILSLWNSLYNWITYKTLVKLTNEKKMENYLFANQSVIKIFIIFVSKLSPYYIASLLILLISLIKNDIICNKNIFLTNNYFYKWLFEIIFYFYNKYNEKLIEEKEKSNIELIKNHSMELYKYYLSIEDKRKISNSKMINYLLDYSYYLKSKNKNNEDQIKEITKITRLLLSTITNITKELFDTKKESSLWDMDELTRVCFEFMLIYKNNFVSYNKKDKKEEKKEGKKEDKKDKIKDLSENMFSINNKSENRPKYDSDQEIDEKKEQDEEKKEKKEIKEIKNKKKDKDKNLLGDILSTNDINDFEIIDRKSSFDKEESDYKKENKNKNFEGLINSKLTPEILYENIYFKEAKDKKDEDNMLENIIIQEINEKLEDKWEDYFIYNSIIEYYYNKVWGMKNICEIVKIKYHKENIYELFKELLILLEY